ncbi:MAG: tetratricopeptide repeat protein [Pseudomonadales bacterium]
MSDNTSLQGSRTMYWHSKVIFFVSLCCLSVPLLATDLYREGEAAFKRGDLLAAKTAFENLYSQNTKNQEAAFSLATVYFEMADYNAARSLFEKVTAAKMAPYAWYYLGRIAEANDDVARAKTLYQQAADQDDVLAAQDWADTALLSLEHFGALLSPVSNKERVNNNSAPSFAFVGLETKYTDGLVDPVDTTAVDVADPSYALLLAGSAHLLGSPSSYELRLGGTYFGEHYAEFDEYNIDSASVYTELGAKRGANLFKAKFEYQYLWLDGQQYLQQLGGTLSDKISFGNKTSLYLHGRYIAVASPSQEFERYDGDVLEAQIRLQGTYRLRWLLDYSYRTEDREDLEGMISNAVATFTSYSRDGHQLRARLAWDYSNNWSQMLEVSYRTVEYNDPDVFFSVDSGDIERLQRENDRVKLRVEITRRITDKFDIGLLYERFDEDSNNDIYDIDSKSISLGLNYLFW